MYKVSLNGFVSNYNLAIPPLCHVMCLFFFPSFLLVLCASSRHNWTVESSLWYGHSSSARDLSENNLLLKIVILWIMKHITEGQSKLYIIEETYVCKMQKKTLSYISPTMCCHEQILCQHRAFVLENPWLWEVIVVTQGLLKPSNLLLLLYKIRQVTDSIQTTVCWYWCLSRGTGYIIISICG